MRVLIAAACAGAGLLAAGGCHCAHLTDAYADHIDDFRDHPWPTLDHYYHPGLDLTRIGKPDWCSCPINQAIGHDECLRHSIRFVPQPGSYPPYVPISASGSAAPSAGCPPQDLWGPQPARFN